MSKNNDPVQHPLAGGDYIRNDAGLRRISKPTAPAPGKYETPGKPAPAAKPAPDKGKPADATPA